MNDETVNEEDAELLCSSTQCVCGRSQGRERQCVCVRRWCCWGWSVCECRQLSSSLRLEKRDESPPLLLPHLFILSLSRLTISQSPLSHSSCAQLRLYIPPFLSLSHSHSVTHTPLSCCWAQPAPTAALREEETFTHNNKKEKKRIQNKKTRMRMSVCGVPALPCCRPTQTVRSFTPPLLLLLMLLSSSSSSSIGAVPSPFQLAPDTPAPAEPTPTQATPRPDPCEGRPCLNGGFCLALPSAGRPEDTWEYTCTCSQGFTGRNCEVWTYFVFSVCVLDLISYGKDCTSSEN